MPIIIGRCPKCGEPEQANILGKVEICTSCGYGMNKELLVYTNKEEEVK